MGRVLRQFIADLAPLCVAGLAILQISLLNWTLRLEGETDDWAQYLALGTAFPIFVLLLARLAPLLQALLQLVRLRDVVLRRARLLVVCRRGRRCPGHSRRTGPGTDSHPGKLLPSAVAVGFPAFAPEASCL